MKHFLQNQALTDVILLDWHLTGAELESTKRHGHAEF